MSGQLYEVYDPIQDDRATPSIVKAGTPEQAASIFCERRDNADNCVHDVRIVHVRPNRKGEWTGYRVSAAPVKVVYTATKQEN